jgi:hypothetical protein
MIHPVRAVLTLLGVAVAGFLIWLSTQFGGGLGSYWVKIGILAAAGLALPLSQLFGGWTKWGWPRVSVPVLLVGFLPALVVAGWVILSGQPDTNWFQRHVTSWSGDLHISRLVRHLRETYLDVLAFGLGAVFGFSFDTTGPRTPKGVMAWTTPVPAAGAAPVVAPPDTVAAVRSEDEAVTVAQPAAATDTAATLVGPTAPEETAETRVTPSGETTPPG